MSAAGGRFRRAVFAAASLFALCSASAIAQPRQSRLIVSVADETGAILPGATVTVTAEDGRMLPPVVTQPDGTAIITSVAPGRYRVSVEFPGFEMKQLSDVRVRAGDNRQSVVLTIEKLQDTVTVGQDERSAAADPRGRAFGSALTREQIDALSDDPDEARRQLQEMVGATRSFAWTASREHSFRRNRRFDRFACPGTRLPRSSTRLAASLSTS